MLKALFLMYGLPMLVLALLIVSVRIKCTGSKLKSTLVWSGSYLIFTFGFILLSTVQYYNGCGFGLGDCYSTELPEGFFGMKMMAVITYYLWLFAAVFSLAKRLLIVQFHRLRKGL